MTLFGSPRSISGRLPCRQFGRASGPFRALEQQRHLVRPICISVLDIHTEIYIIVILDFTENLCTRELLCLLLGPAPEALPTFAVLWGEA